MTRLIASPSSPARFPHGEGAACSLPFLEAAGFCRTLPFCWPETWARERRQRSRQAPRSAMPLPSGRRAEEVENGFALPSDSRLNTGLNQKWLAQKAAR